MNRISIIMQFVYAHILDFMHAVQHESLVCVKILTSCQFIH